jgi:hypothetical protein
VTEDYERRRAEMYQTEVPKMSMTALEYRAALEVLGLSQQAAGRWLMVSPKTAQNYATKGPSGPAARAVMMALKLTAKAWADELARAEK